ncbi:MAG TPA: ABC transporter permease [Vicinamibacteria bacterium]|nr:ABC transporter permease [Vicinamibacteria bacterium]
MSFRKVVAIARKELRQAARDPLSLAMLLGVPTMMLLLYGFALNFDVRHIRLAVQDRDRTPQSRELVASFVNSRYFDRVADLGAGADLERVTETREARAILVIPEGYGDKILGRRPSPVQLVLDGADSNTASTILNYANAIVADQNATLMREALGTRQGAALDLAPRVLYNPELKSTQFLVPGLIGFILMLTAVLSTAMSIVREKERGTMEQLRVTSLRPGELIAGKTLPYLGISLTATGIILVAARVLFGVAVRGPYLDLFVATLVYLIGALGFGLLVSSFSDTQALAFQAGSVTSMLPAIFLSGFIFPIRAMPEVLQWLTYAVPARYFNVILRGVILKGAGLQPYAWDLAFLVLYAAVVLGIAYVRLTRREA